MRKRGLLLAGAAAAAAAYGGYRAVKAIKEQPAGTKKYYLRGTAWVYKGYPKGTPRAQRKKAVVIGSPHKPGRVETFMSTNRVSRYTQRKLRTAIRSRQQKRKQSRR